jgi:hypothetical protein
MAASGGIVTMIINSGATTFTAAPYEYFRNEDLNASNFSSTTLSARSARKIAITVRRQAGRPGLDSQNLQR